MEKLIKYLYYISLLCFALPSGDVFGIPVKLLVTFGLLIITFLWILVKNKPIVIDFVIKGFIFVIVALMIWACIGTLNGYETVFLCLKSFLSLLVTVLCSYLLIKNGFVSVKGATKVLYITAILMVAIKFFCELMLVLGILDWNQFRELYVTITGTSVTTMEIPFGGIIIYRIMATNDFLPLVLVGFYLLYAKTSIVKKVLVIGVLGVYTFIVYSRVAMLQYGVIILFYLASLLWDFLKKTTRKKTILVISLSAAFVVIVGVLFIYKSETILSYAATFIESMYERWFGESASYSDSFRVEQKEYLWAGIWETPVLGQGLGSYIRGYLRSNEFPFSYEAEYLSFVYQFGVIGFMLIIGGIIAVFAKMCFSNRKRIRMNLLILLNFGIWALRPLYNPQLLSSSSGMIIVAIFLAGCYYSQSTIEKSKVN